MNKRLKRSLTAFSSVQRLKPQYLLSQFVVHEQAIREHLARGHNLNGPLLDARNKI